MPEHARSTADARKAHWFRAFAIITVAFISGIICGGAGISAYDRTSGKHGHDRQPKMDPTSVMAYLRDELHMPPEKEPEVRAILRKHHANFMAVRRATMPRVQELFDQLREDVAGQLSPERAARWRAQFETSQRHSFPIRKMIWLADSNDDGLVDWEELHTGFPEVGKEWFTKADADQNGSLDEGEISNMAEEPELVSAGPP